MNERMAEFILNPRKAPRAPVRCRADLTGTDGARWTSETEDVGPRGCQVVAPHRRPRGEQLLLLISTEGLSRSLRVGGRIAWVSAAEPWRLGIAFSEQDAAVAADWYDALVAKNPALSAYRGVPDRLSTEATLFLGPPPKLVDFTREEIQVLRCIGSGVSVGEVRSRLRDIWERAQHGLFSLLVRRHLVLARGASVLPVAWKPIMTELEATLAVEELERTAPRGPWIPTAPPPPARTPPPTREPSFSREPPPAYAPVHGGAPGRTPPPVRTPPPGRDFSREPPAAYAPVREEPAPLPGPTPAHPSRAETRASTRAIDAGGTWSGAEPRHDFQGAGVGWRSQPRPRSPQADHLFRQASLEAEAGKVEAAIGMLRQALQIAPGDPEIAALLGKLAFRDRAAPKK